MQQGGPSSSLFMSPMPYRARRRGSSLRDVEGLEHPARGEDLEGTLGEAVHAPRSASSWSKAAAEVVELAQQRAAAGEALGSIAASSRLSPDAAGAACCAARLRLGAERRERGVGQAQVARVAGVAPARLAGPGREPDERRDVGVDRPLETRDDRPQAGPAPLRLADQVAVAGQALAGRVVAARPDDRADHRELVHHPRQPGHVLADVEPRHVGRDRPELAADSRRARPA